MLVERILDLRIIGVIGGTRIGFFGGARTGSGMLGDLRRSVQRRAPAPASLGAARERRSNSGSGNTMAVPE